MSSLNLLFDKYYSNYMPQVLVPDHLVVFFLVTINATIVTINATIVTINATIVTIIATIAI